MTKKKKLYIFTNFANSMDGKIASFEREDVKPTKEDRALMDFHRSRADVILNGAGTVRSHPRAHLIQSQKLINKRIKQGMSPHPANAVISFSLNLDPQSNYFQNAQRTKILIVPENTPTKKLEKFENHCAIIQYKKNKPIAAQVIKALNKLGFYRILIEGGGKMMFPWVEGNWIDEWNITISPKIYGGENSPTMVEGPGLKASEIKYYKLNKVKKVKNDVFLQYVRLKTIGK